MKLEIDEAKLMDKIEPYIRLKVQEMIKEEGMILRNHHQRLLKLEKKK